MGQPHGRIMQLVSGALLATILVSGCGGETPTSSSELSESSALGTLYHNGTLLTMANSEPTVAEALVEQNGEIVFVGPLTEARALAGDDVVEFDLAGATLMPGFIEPHLHPSLAAVMLENEIIAPYDWTLPSGIKYGVSGEENYRDRVTQSIEENANPDELYLIWGFHQLWHGSLSKEVLNQLAGEQPVGIIHRSFHEIYLNDAAISLLGIAREDFAGNSHVDWEKGHFYEAGWLELVPIMAPILLDPDKYLSGLATMTSLLRMNGITTIAEPGFPSANFDAELAMLKSEMATNPPYDVYLIPNGTQLYAMQGGNVEAMEFMEGLASSDQHNTENIHFLPKQVKLFADGAIYSQLMQMKDGYIDGHEGEWMTPLELFNEQIELYWRNDYKIHVHANGDLGQQMVIDSLANLQANSPREDHRLTLHHMGYFTEDMAQEMSELGMEASLNPYYLWALADKYAEFGLGPERAENLVALRLLVERGIPVSFHSDFSMAPAEPLTLAWTAVNRVTAEGTLMSQDQRVSIYDALKAITIDSARSLNLETEIGSLEEGKVANFTILGANPLEVDEIQLKELAIHGVVYRGDFYPARPD